MIDFLNFTPKNVPMKVVLWLTPRVLQAVNEVVNAENGRPDRSKDAPRLTLEDALSDIVNKAVSSQLDGEPAARGERKRRSGKAVASAHGEAVKTSPE